MRKRVLSILLALSVILAYVPMMGVTAVAEGEVDTTPLTFTSDQPFSVTIATPGWNGTMSFKTGTDDWDVWDKNASNKVVTSKVGASGKQEIQFKGDGNNVIPYFEYDEDDKADSESVKPWSIDGTKVSISGNIMTLLDCDKPATAMDRKNCYAFYSLFKGNESITDASQLKLPATELEGYCYEYMFRGCTSLTEAPKLPAKTVGEYSYAGMFSGCTSLTEVPELLFTWSFEGSCAWMFEGCISLTEVPKLPASAVFDYCYKEMLKGCTNIKLYANPESVPDNSIAKSWYAAEYDDEFVDVYFFMFSQTGGDFKGSPEGGRTYYYAYTPSAPTGDVEDALTLTGSEPFSVETGRKGWDGIVYYREDNGKWSAFSAKKPVSAVEKDGKYVLQFCGTHNNHIGDICVDDETEEVYPNCTPWSISSETSNNSVELSGNIMTLLNYKDPASVLTEQNAFAFSYLFCDDDDEEEESHNDNECITDASQLKLPATKLSDSCYQGMFQMCTGLTEAPELPATDMAYLCYSGMFSGCESLKEAPELPATILDGYCYECMFEGCKGLTEIPELPATATHENSNCYGDMFKECTKIKLYDDKVTMEKDFSSDKTYVTKTWSIPSGATWIDYAQDGENEPMFADTGGNVSKVEAGTTYYYSYATEEVTYDNKPEAIKDASYYVSLTLNDKIDVNFTIKNTSDGFDKSKLDVLVNGNSIGNENITENGGNLKCVLCSKAPQDVDRTFKVQVKYDNVVVKEFKYKVRDYCRNIIKNYPTPNEEKGVNDEFLALCKAFLYYTSYADICDAGDGTDFVGDKSDYLDALTDTTPAGKTIDTSKAGTSKASLSIGEDGIALNFIVQSTTEITRNNVNIVNDCKTPEKVNSDNISVTKTGNVNEYLVKVSNIGASKLARTYTLTVDGNNNLKVEYGVYNYLASMCGTDSEASDNDKNFYQAMYIYGQAANAYYKTLS